MVKQLKRYVGLGPKFDKELNKVWQGTFFSWMNLHPEHSLEDCVAAANKATKEYHKTREGYKNEQ